MKERLATSNGCAPVTHEKGAAEVMNSVNKLSVSVISGTDYVSI